MKGSFNMYGYEEIDKNLDFVFPLENCTSVITYSHLITFLEVTEEKWLQWLAHLYRIPGNRLPWKILEWEPEGRQRN
jgi:hypothetical protein